MANPSRDAEARLYFGRITVAVVESGELEADILCQIFNGFKVRHVRRYTSTGSAQPILLREDADLLVVGNCPPSEGELDEYDFIRWLRRCEQERMRKAPVILLAGHTLQANVIRARDCGANFVIAKPVTPTVLFDRIAWLARDGRQFIECPSYCGPDRRFQKLGPPPGTNGRRHDDLSLKVGEAKMPNMSQAEIDAMFNGGNR